MKYITLIVALLTLLTAPLARAEWELILGTEEMGIIYTLETNGIGLYAGTEHGVFVSLDDGYSWRPTDLNHEVFAFAVGWDDAVYANGGRKHGLYRSDTLGITWKEINNGLHTWEQDDGRPEFPFFGQILTTSSHSVIAVGHPGGTYISHNRGDSWHDVYFDKDHEWTYSHPAWEKDYKFGYDIRTMTEFDGYLWAYADSKDMYRSPDNGETWHKLPEPDDINRISIPVLKEKFSEITHWAALDDRLYVAAADAFGRWNEGELNWENLNEGLPVDDTELPAYREYLRTIYDISTLTVNRGRIFAGVRRRQGVWVFDERSRIWFPVGLKGRHVNTLVSHQSALYAVTDYGIYRASIPAVNVYNKLVTTWGAIKTK